MSKYPLASSTWGPEELQAIQNVIDSDMYSMGTYTAQFEDYFSAYTGRKYSVMVNSGSSANLLAIAALFYRKENPLKPGDEIIVPAVSWSTTYFPLQQYGLKVKFVDIDLDTLNINLSDLEAAITDKTRAIFLVNLLGNPNDFDAIQDLIKDKDIILLEDNCEGLGATYGGKQAGSFGLMGTYSTFFSHHISTMEGGVITTDDEELYHILLSLRAHGWTRNLPMENKVTGKKSINTFEESFKFVLPGYNVRPLEMSAAIGIEQLKKLPRFIEQRRKNALVFQNLFKDNSNFYTQKEIGKSSWFGFSLIKKFNSPSNRDELAEKLSKAGVDVRPIVAGNFTKNEVIKYFNYEIHGRTYYADYLDKEGFFVGNHHYDISDKLLYLRDIIE